MRPSVHVIGAGLAGLSAAIRLAEGPCEVVLHEAARHAGGRCRSFFEPSLNATIDNGNHLLLSGNSSALAYLQTIGARDELVGPDRCEIAFADVATAERWVLRPNEGRLPWWIFSSKRRVPETRAIDYLAGAHLLRARKSAVVADVIPPIGALYDRLWAPFFVAALNASPKQGSAALAAGVLRETLARGGSACHPLIAANGLSRAFVDPALKLLRQRGGQARFERRLRGLTFSEAGAATLEFEHDSIALGPADAVVLATPPHIAATLAPGLCVPLGYNAILNAHFSVAPPAKTPPILGVVNGVTQWVFAHPDRLSVTVSDANKFMDAPREELAVTLWREVAALTGLADDLPSWRIIKERRATFAATPEDDARRPPSATQWPNLFLAGDYVKSHLPATIEGAIRSGEVAARLAMERAAAL